MVILFFELNTTGFDAINPSTI